MDQRLELVVSLRNGGRIEGARLENVGAGFQVVAVDAADDVGAGQDQQVVVALEVVRVIGEALAAVVGFLQPVALDHRAHRAVEDEKTSGEESGKF